MPVETKQEYWYDIKTHLREDKRKETQARREQQAREANYAPYADVLAQLEETLREMPGNQRIGIIDAYSLRLDRSRLVGLFSRIKKGEFTDEDRKKALEIISYLLEYLPDDDKEVAPSFRKLQELLTQGSSRN